MDIYTKDKIRLFFNNAPIKNIVIYSNGKIYHQTNSFELWHFDGENLIPLSKIYVKKPGYYKEVNLSRRENFYIIRPGVKCSQAVLYLYNDPSERSGITIISYTKNKKREQYEIRLKIEGCLEPNLKNVDNITVLSDIIHRSPDDVLAISQDSMATAKAKKIVTMGLKSSNHNSKVYEPFDFDEDLSGKNYFSGHVEEPQDRNCLRTSRFRDYID